MKGLEEHIASAMKKDRPADTGVALLDDMTKSVNVKQITTKAGDNISYSEFSSWKSKDLIDDN